MPAASPPAAAPLRPLVVGFGEVLGRLCPPGHRRFAQAAPGAMELTFAGAEANVAVSVAHLGGRSRFVTALPRHPLADACVAELRRHGVDVDHVLRTDAGRLGLYFVEKGASQRPSRVVYDREATAISRLEPGDVDWDAALAGAGWLHLSGVTPALSEAAFRCTVEAARRAAAVGIPVSCDLNFRGKLWSWRPGADARTLAREAMPAVLAHVDHVIANEEDAADALGVELPGGGVHAGALDTARYPAVARAIAERFPHVKKVAITLRESVSASHNRWGALLYEADGGRASFAPVDGDGGYRPHELHPIVDRVGGGDAFAAGLIFALTTPELADGPAAVRFAVAASCLAHAHEGDFNLSTRAEVERLAGGNGSGRVLR